MASPEVPGTRGDVPLTTNAPPGWPTVLAPEQADGSASARVVDLTRRVEDALHESGFHVEDVGRTVRVGQQLVKVDIVATAGGVEVPVFVFPGADSEREGQMFAFLGAAISETRAFAAAPVYYSAGPLGSVGSPSRELIARRADVFLRRALESGADLSFASTPGSVVSAVRGLAAVPIESGGGDTVTDAACFVGEWLRAQAGGEWVLRDDLPRSVLLVSDPLRSTQWHLPLFAWFPDAVRMGYDGLAGLLESVIAIASPDEIAEDEETPVTWPAYRRKATAWIDEMGLRGAREADWGAILRSCAACGLMNRVDLDLDSGAGTVDRAVERVLEFSSVSRAPCEACASLDYRETLLLYSLPVDGTRALVVAEFSESHVRVTTREMAPRPYHGILG